jgi:gliding motility-associated lipoprotein GldH
MKKRLFIYILLLNIVCGLGCIRSNIYEKNASISGHKWSSSYKPTFEFEISDTSASYNAYFTMRHTEAYPFSNIWIKLQMTEPGKPESESIKIDIPLAQTDGKWLGRGANEIWEHRMPLGQQAASMKFKQKGKYIIRLQHLMRTDPLPEILSIGIRLEKQAS